ncbi:MAG TPA: translation initiation factor IF-3 [Candidatus Hydrogenedentes bacterium]|nr:translation initiation factor IF-3 [Candidatus Hydrogenedentota bacterium]HPJ99256.1 translation initiation factor IF-3 [Candidatus Hydrogenedentota bacterium]
MRINERIRARQVRVIDDEGEQLGIMSPEDALREAEERGLDLVEVAPNARPPVCRILDFGKYKYQQSKRAKESRKHQHVVTIKEVKYRPKIDKHDFNYKTSHVREFLEDGNKVKLTIMFRGREMTHPEFGRDILARVVEATADLLDELPDASRARLEGRNMILMLTPGKNAQKKPRQEPRRPVEEKGPEQVVQQAGTDIEADIEPEE